MYSNINKACTGNDEDFAWFGWENVIPMLEFGVGLGWVLAFSMPTNDLFLSLVMPSFLLFNFCALQIEYGMLNQNLKMVLQMPSQAYIKFSLTLGNFRYISLCCCAVISSFTKNQGLMQTLTCLPLTQPLYMYLYIYLSIPFCLNKFYLQIYLSIIFCLDKYY